ncbi:MAG: hypothetical protein HN580_07250 [Deltaproteobacteria bacterium]|nr:hypothetical protein [Deltaproteobacteria bacterium]MBT4262636.1 hypothetical protein [Deltaproteobacteria bacterium]MBT4641994.1 hypothetical protein [Deltaproteobacteria bacterium]MBT6503733.1 hypothetical protein [Deltaproteobacteria bacterium]MBT7151339.1 hypothetical protein [Deltaproteobacteria bacterium]
MATPPGSEIYATVGDAGAGEVGVAYTVSIVEQPAAGEGLAGTPVNIDADLPGYLGVVAPSGFANPDSFYEITGLDSGNAYYIMLTGLSGDVDLEVYDTANFDNSPICSGDIGYVTEACPTTTGYTSLFIKAISADDKGAFFMIDVTPPPVDEGTTGSPINITGLTPYAGQSDTVQSSSASYYVIENLIPGGQAMVTLSLVTDDVELVVYDDSAYSNEICYVTDSQLDGRVPEICAGLTVNPSGRLYLEARKDNKSNSIGSTYMINVIQ